MGDILEGEEEEYRKLTSSQVFQLLEDHETFVLEERHKLNSLMDCVNLPTYIELNPST